MHTVDWHIEGEILRIELWGDIASSEIKTINDFLVSNYLEKSTNAIHLIVVGTNISQLKANIGEISMVTKGVIEHPNLGLSVYVDISNPIASFIANSLTKLFDYPYKTCKTFEQALIHIEKYKKSQNSSKGGITL